MFLIMYLQNKTQQCGSGCYSSCESYNHRTYWSLLQVIIKETMLRPVSTCQYKYDFLVIF